MLKYIKLKQELKILSKLKYGQKFLNETEIYHTI